MRWMLLALAALVGAAVPLPVEAQGSAKTVMVVDFADLVTGSAVTQEVVTLRVVAALREDPAVRVLSRDRVRAALSAARAEVAGTLDGDTAREVARTLEADYVIMGQVFALSRQERGVCLPIVACVGSITATVRLEGRVLDVATGVVTARPRAEVKREEGSGSLLVGPWWARVSVSTRSDHLVEQAIQEAVEAFMAQARPALR